MRTWSTDIEDLPRDDDEAAPAAARRRARFTRDLVEAATSRDGYERWRTAVRCIARPARRACEGRIVVYFDEDREEVEWESDGCGERGVIRGFSCCEHDMSDFLPCNDVVVWRLAEQARGVLWEATRGQPDLRAVIARASPDVEHPEVVVVEATLDELDYISMLVDELLDGTGSRRRRALLDGLRASLSVSMGGF